MKKVLATLVMLLAVAFAAPAFAANPFMDVPAGHWAYDAVAQLAARGIVSGYPDGAYKGAQPATRYEMASIVARAMTRIDMEKASRQDVEIMKKLMLEFKDELDALGVKTDQLDKRVSKLEDGVGGWKIRGTFRFDAKFGDSDSNSYAYNKNGMKNNFSKEQFRLYLTKQIDENTSFYAQYRVGADGAPGYGTGDQDEQRWSHLYVDTKLPWDMGLRVGRFAVDFEDDYGLYTDNDAIFGDFRIDGFRVQKDFGFLTATGIVGRNDDFTDDIATNAIASDTGTHMTYAMDLHFQPNEKFFVGATGYWMMEDSAPDGKNGDYDANTYAGYLGYNFTPAIQLKGIYYMQDLGQDVAQSVNYWSSPLFGDAEDSPKAWKAILDVKQDFLKFTSLWAEYSQQDNTFWSPGVASARYSIGGSAYDYVGKNVRFADPDGQTKFMFVQAKQQWNDKWSTFVRYAQAQFDSSKYLDLDDAKEWGLGVGYQYTPAIYFELAYDQIDHGNDGSFNPGNDEDYGYDKDSVFRFRTTVQF